MTTHKEISMDIALMEPVFIHQRILPRWHKGQPELASKLGLTSLELFWIIVGLEDKYQLTIPWQIIESMTTLDNLVEYVVDNVNRRS